jgi:hydroxyacylglutathione hydrolase
MKIIIMPLNGTSENYGYLVIEGGDVLVVDVSNCPEDVLAAIAKEEVEGGEKLNFKYILTTHKHWDHAGGNDKVRALHPNVRVFCGEADKAEGFTDLVKDDEMIQGFGSGAVSIRCIHTPGHTMGHICYYLEHGEQRAVFTGDFLFAGGAGRFFEGSAKGT